MPLSDRKISFLLQNSLVDAKGGAIPVFLRGSPTTIERGSDDLTLTEIAAARPAICPDDGAIVLHPESKNEVNWNVNPSNSSWVKGSFVTTFIDRDPGIDRTYLSERIVWTTGTGSTQLIRKQVELAAGSQHCLSFVTKLDAGSFRPGDVIRVVGGVVGSPQISLSNLNQFSGKRRKLTFNFTTTGGSPIIPVTTIDYYSIVAVTSTTVVVNLGTSVLPGDLIDAQLIFTGTPVRYIVTANSAADSLGNTIITVGAPTLIANGITTSTKVKIAQPPNQTCFIELYCENTATLEWGSIQIEAKAFPTAQIIQKQTFELRTSSLLFYNRSPFLGKENFGVYVNFKHWAGDGNILETSDLGLKIQSGQLLARVGSITLAASATLADNAEIFLQIASSKNQAYLYVDGFLVAENSISGFVGAPSKLDFTSEGVREYLSIAAIDGILSPGEIILGDKAKGEIRELFASNTFLVGTSLLSKIPELILPSTIVPPIVDPPNSIVIGTIPSSREINLRELTGFTVGSLVTIENDGIFILEATVLRIFGTSSLQLDTPVDVVGVGYQIRQGNPAPGRSTIRFPFDPIDVQDITGILPGNTLVLAVSALSFTPGRAIVQDAQDRFITEIIIASVNTGARQVTVDSITNILVGHKISQPSSELLVDPDNYLAAFTQNSGGIEFITLAQNGVEIQNSNSDPIDVTVTVKIIL